MANLTFSPLPQGSSPSKNLIGTQSTTPQYAIRAPQTSLQSAYGDQGSVTGYGSSTVNSGIMGVQAKNPNANLVMSNNNNTLPSSQATPLLKPGSMNTDGTYTVGTGDKYNPWNGQALSSDQTAGSILQKPTASGGSNNSQSSNSGLFSNVAQNLSTTAVGGNAGTTNAAANGLMGQTTTNPASTNINRLTDISNNQTPEVTAAQKDYNTFAQSSPYMVAAQYNPNVAADVASGRAGLLGQTFSAELNAKQAAVNNALTGENQQIGAANSAGGLGLTGQSQQINAGTNAGNLGISQQQTQNQAANTLLGTPGGALSTYGLMGQGTSGMSPQNTASSLAQQVISGKMSYQDAVNSLGYAGSAGQQFLNQAIQSISPGFNTQQAQTNTQVQGTLGPQGNLASAELNNLQQTLNSIPGLQNTSIPLVNQFTRWVGSLTGNANSQQLKDAQSAAVSAVKTALGTAYGGTPTSFDSLVNAWFPDGATNQQVQAGIQQFNALMQARQQSFNSPGTTSFTPAGSSNTSTGNSYGFSSFLGS